MILIYDGACGFCARCAAWAARRLPDDVRVAPYQDLNLGEWSISTESAAAAAWALGQAKRVIYNGIDHTLETAGLGQPCLGQDETASLHRSGPHPLAATRGECLRRASGMYDGICSCSACQPSCRSWHQHCV